MNNYSEDDIISFLTEITANDKIDLHADIFSDLRVTGDDFHEMMEKYQQAFHVNMETYLWYFHCDEEGINSIGSAFFKPPYERVKRIPVSPKMMLDFANAGNWNIDYPEHTVPKRRYDLMINSVVVIGSIAILLYHLLF